MSIPNVGRRKVQPTHPGRILRLDFMPDYGLTVTSLARALGVSRQSASDLTRERKAVSPEMALRLARLFGNSAQLWLNLQREVDLWRTEEEIGAKLERIKPISAA